MAAVFASGAALAEGFERRRANGLIHVRVRKMRVLLRQSDQEFDLKGGRLAVLGRTRPA